MEYREFSPSPALHGIVRCYWTLQADHQSDAAAPEPACPDGSPELIVNLADPFVAIGANGERVTQPRAFLVGQITRPLLVAPTGRVDLVAVRFESYGAMCAHDHLAQLTDRSVALAALPHPLLNALGTTAIARAHLSISARICGMACRSVVTVAGRGRVRLRRPVALDSRLSCVCGSRAGGIPGPTVRIHAVLFANESATPSERRRCCPRRILASAIAQRLNF